MNASHGRLQAGRITLALQANGLMNAGALSTSLGVSRPTLSRWIRTLGASVERVGAARATQYALRRNVRNLGSEWPLYRLSESGRASQWGTLRALHGGFRFIPANAAPVWLEDNYAYGIFSGLPFFLQDIRPQGYHGRAIAREVSPNLNVPVDPRSWNDDDLMAYLVAEGYDLPGNLVLGDRALEQALRSADALADQTMQESERHSAYPAKADAAQSGAAVGSSAGGEQPKFLASVGRSDGSRVSVLVKFTAAEASPVRERWADLLICEHLAAETLVRHGVPSASTQVLEGGGRRFLEVERFDRMSVVGRRGLLSLGAIDDALSDESAADPSWTTMAARLRLAGVIDTANERELSWRWCFGNLIANTDMHGANTSLWFGDTLPFSLTPSYDMLPMQFAPGPQGELGERTLSPRPPWPSIHHVWREAASAAAEFWAEVIADPRISPSFLGIARDAASIVRDMAGRYT